MSMDTVESRATGVLTSRATGTVTNRATGTVIGITAVIAASAAVVVVAVIAPAPVPATLAAPKQATTVATTERTFDDARQAQLRLVEGSPRAVTAPRSGTLTSSDCASGRTVSSGSVVATIDGIPVVALATRLPLWRDLLDGDRGEDVTALQAELTRLGHPTVADGVVGTSTLRAAADLLAAAGTDASARRSAADGPALIAAAAFAWLPAPAVTTRRCTAVVGTPVTAGDELLTLPPEVVAARVTSIPADASPGPRVVRLGETDLSVDDDGAVTGAEDLQRLARAPEAAAALADDGGSGSVAVQWLLARPIDVLVVPPSALWGIRDRHGCLLAQGDARPILVEVAGSDLGQSFVVAPAGAVIRAVVARPSTATSCR
jgi:biotin carboxyl carrier protein